MISVRQAVDAAVSYVKQFQELMGPEIRLEETVLSEEDRPIWRITLGVRDSPFASSVWRYKIFEVDAQDGEILSMKNRQLGMDS